MASRAELQKREDALWLELRALLDERRKTEMAEHEIMLELRELQDLRLRMEEV